MVQRVRAHRSEHSPAGRDEADRAPTAGHAGAASRGHGGQRRGVAPVRPLARGRRGGAATGGGESGDEARRGTGPWGAGRSGTRVGGRSGGGGSAAAQQQLLQPATGQGQERQGGVGVADAVVHVRQRRRGGVGARGLTPDVGEWQWGAGRRSWTTATAEWRRGRRGDGDSGKTVRGSGGAVLVRRGRGSSGRDPVTAWSWTGGRAPVGRREGPAPRGGVAAMDDDEVEGLRGRRGHRDRGRRAPRSRSGRGGRERSARGGMGIGLGFRGGYGEGVGRPVGWARPAGPDPGGSFLLFFC